MSSLTDSAADLAESMLDVAWRQWSAIGGSAANARPVQSIVDPEALVLYTHSAMGRNQRLESILFSWLEVNGELLSVQRMKNLVGLFPAQVASQLPDFARNARNVAAHPRWTALSGGAETAPDQLPVALPESRRAVRTPLRQSCALLLRLRLAMGVGVKADVLSVLIGQKESRSTVKEIVDFTGYTNVAVRGALESLAEAGFVDARPGRPQSYSAPQDRWSALLGISRVPAWQPWAQFYAFGLAIGELVDHATVREFSDYALRTKIRELVEDAPLLFGHIASPHSVHTADSDLVAQDSMAMLSAWAAVG